jgi:nucleoside-diphosphate-sugar epimerase
MQTVLVTGAGGFIGKMLAKALQLAGLRVVGLFRDIPEYFRSHTSEQSSRTIAVFGDIVDSDGLLRVLVNYDVDAVVHLAAHSAVKKCEENPRPAYLTNVMGVVSLLDACRLRHRDHPLSKIVVATTDKVYGDGDVPYVEYQPLRAKGPYSTSKVCADYIARDYGATYGLPVVVARSSNVYGPGDTEPTRLIPGSIQRLLRGESAIVYESALEMEREFVYIADEVSAYLTLLFEPTKPDHTIFNIGGSGPVPVVSVVKRLAALCKGAYEIRPSSHREIGRQYVDASRLHALGWRQHTTLDDGLRLTVEWFRSQRAKATQGMVAIPGPEAAR